MQFGMPVLIEMNSIEDCAAADDSDEPVIMRRVDSLSHMHVHDARGRGNHLVLGDGDLNLRRYLDLAATRDCRAVLEVKTVEGLRRSVAWVKENEGLGM